jgi:plastocyanin domain-containing protein
MKATLISIIITGLLIIGAILFARSGGVQTGEEIPLSNVTMEAGKQIVEIRARGGYQPRVSLAKAGVPTVLRLNTMGTFDCSSSVRIPALGVLRNLPPTGITDIELGTPVAGVLQGMCGMGMYPFEIEFK